MDYVVETITKDEDAYSETYHRYTAGRLKELYRLVNKIMSYNIHPYCREKRRLKMMVILYLHLALVKKLWIGHG